ncbi:TetR family transcriptional regulator [Frankia sp. CNm7]|uniref:TetR family transcriptional regulator n=1 Tax=Frankia nepalensis TaxID=1836974 RepID=A0A937UR36_9ACTN|nr:TetR family transcriptional regulator [Frankia nepalensis]MBL7501265.1 TetR family transcriptional regulator [Frankia nepalensis]MBL7511481.1 TetR family transcriptional regulator [Frankia nepalensis]MBL7519544.1 TetR family transcriptional regulator [Frankia nepalensis]MBL7627346.1 TetR family transcriptional regulator [Frankia nepalensis]
MSHRQAAGERQPVSRLPVGLDAEAVLTAALALIDEHGVSGFTIRRLGEQLGVSAPTIYWHVGSKAALFAGVVDRVLSSMMIDTDEGETWERRLRLFMTAAREQLLAHPHVLDLISPIPSRAVSRWTREALAIMRQAGFADADAAAYTKATLFHILGYARAEATIRTVNRMEPVPGATGLVYRVKPDPPGTDAAHQATSDADPASALMRVYDLDEQHRVVTDIFVAGIQAGLEKARASRQEPTDG